MTASPFGFCDLLMPLVKLDFFLFLIGNDNSGGAFGYINLYEICTLVIEFGIEKKKQEKLLYQYYIYICNIVVFGLGNAFSMAI